MLQGVILVRPPKYFANIFGAGVPLLQVVSIEHVGYNKQAKNWCVDAGREASAKRLLCYAERQRSLSSSCHAKRQRSIWDSSLRRTGKHHNASSGQSKVGSGVSWVGKPQNRTICTASSPGWR